MTKNLYKKIADLGKALILENLENPARLAIAPLHIICPHPIVIKNYQKTSNTNSITKIKKIFYTYIRKACAFISPNNLKQLKNFLKKNKIHQIIFSHKIEKNNSKTDFYFGKIPFYISNKQKKTLIIYINHLSWLDSKTKYHVQKKGNNIYSYVMPSWSNFFRECEITKKISQEINILIKRLNPKKYSQANLLYALNRENCLQKSILNYRIYLWAKEIFQLCKPAKVFFTWEGHAWERLIIKAAKEINKETRCIGYQHTILFQDSVGPFLDLGPGLNPNQIWTIGKINESRLKKEWVNKNVNITCAGTPRASEETKQTIKQNLLLVAPDGILSEAQKLFKIGKIIAAKIPNIKVVFRTHPVLPFSEILKRTPDLKKLPSNVILQRNQTLNYINFAKWVLYRGSSLVVEALRKGARPFFFEEKNELNIDPIYFVNYWKKKVSSAKKLEKFILIDLKNKKKKFKEKEAAIKKTNHLFISQSKRLLIDKIKN